MIDHLGLSVADAARSKAFYRAALAPPGYALLMEWEQHAGFGVAPKPDFWIGQGRPNPDGHNVEAVCHHGEGAP